MIGDCLPSQPAPEVYDQEKCPRTCVYIVLLHVFCFLRGFTFYFAHSTRFISAPPSVSPFFCTPVDPCQNGATCIEGRSTFFCVCTSDFTGRRCELARTPPPLSSLKPPREFNPVRHSVQLSLQ